MSPANVPPIGERIRAERMRRGLTVRGLARDIGVSASLISQIETKKSQPSVSTLYAITTALGISVEDLFEPPDVEPAVESDSASAAVSSGGVAAPADRGSVQAAARLATRPAGDLTENPSWPSDLLTPSTAGGDGQSSAQRVVGPDRRRAVGPLVHPNERELLTLDSGVTWERLGQLSHTHVDFLLITYDPGGTSSSAGELMRHSGKEYGYLVSGELVLTLGFDEYRLSAGDAVCFDSTTPHGYRNDGDVPAIGIWFVLERPT